jgi:hypothetical protein
MSTSLYNFSVPVFALALTNLGKQIDKAIAYAEPKKVDGAVFGATRLVVDMLPFSAQVQISCDNAKGAVARLAGVEPPKHEDSEKTLVELKARIAKTVEYINTLKAEQFAGAETRDVVLKFPNMTLKFNGLDYLTKFALPNFYFHATMAYAILRKNGVELGKGDFLGNTQ